MMRFSQLRLLARSLAGLVMLAGALAVTGCATSGQPDPRDPLESVNRATFQFNDKLDQVVLKPVATVYKNVLPDPVRNCVGNFFGNVSDVWTAANEALQGKFHDAGSDVCRVAVNTTVGIGGCFDVASSMNLDKHQKQDFGLTLGHWGVGPGIYIVLPLLGPSNVRDGLGTIVDLYGDPVSYINDVPVRNWTEVLRLVNTRAGLLGAGELLEGASLDKYVFVRDGYFTRRRSQVYDGDPPPETDNDPSPPVQDGQPAKAAPPNTPTGGSPTGK